jgi:hypothetical protein
MGLPLNMWCISHVVRLLTVQTGFWLPHGQFFHGYGQAWSVSDAKSMVFAVTDAIGLRVATQPEFHRWVQRLTNDGMNQNLHKMFIPSSDEVVANKEIWTKDLIYIWLVWLRGGMSNMFSWIWK